MFLEISPTPASAHTYFPPFSHWMHL